jgi:hypothetical protein
VTVLGFILFVLSGGLWFRSRHQKNYIAFFLAGTLALISSILLFQGIIGGPSSIEAVLNREDRADYEVARTENTILSYEVYLLKHPNGQYVDASRAAIAAENLRQDEGDFKAAQKTNTFASYDEYLKNYPKGRFAGSAQREQERLAFEAAKAAGTIASYSEYLKKYANGRYVDDARTAITAENLRRDEAEFKAAQKTNTIASYNEYLANHPEGQHVAAARKAIADEIRQQDEADFKEAQKANTIASYELYRKKHPKGHYFEDAKSAIANEIRRQDKADFDAATSVNTIDSYNAYLEKYPSPGGTYRKDAELGIAKLKDQANFRTAQEDGRFFAYSNYINHCEQWGGACQFKKQASDAMAKLVAIEAEEHRLQQGADFQLTQKTNTVDAYKRYLDKYGSDDYYDDYSCKASAAVTIKQACDAIARLDDDAWSRAEAAGKEADFQKYLIDFRIGRHRREANDGLKKKAQERDDAAWAKAAAGGKEADFQKYLTDFPQGKHSQEGEKKAWGPDDAAWAKAEAAGTEADFQKYLKNFPRGRHAEQARAWIFRKSLSLSPDFFRRNGIE